jgi:hypothetical protein
MLHLPLTVTFSFFLPPTQTIRVNTGISSATAKGERITVLDATFAEEQLRSGTFTGNTPHPNAINPRSGNE